MFISETGQLDSPLDSFPETFRGESQGGEDAGDGDDATHRGQRRGWIPRGVVTVISSSKMMISMGFLWIYGIKHGDFMGIDQ